MVAEADAKLASAPASNVKFQLRDLEDGLPAGVFGLVSCMGVASTIIDDNIFNDLVNQLTRSTADHGYLLTKDSLGVENDKKILTGPYVTVYRSMRRYEDRIAKSGFELISKINLADGEDLVNNIYLWKKP